MSADENSPVPRKRPAEAEPEADAESNSNTTSTPPSSDTVGSTAAATGDGLGDTKTADVGWSCAPAEEVAQRRIVRPARGDDRDLTKETLTTGEETSQPFGSFSGASELTTFSSLSSGPAPLSFNFDFPTSLATSWTSLGSSLSSEKENPDETSTTVPASSLFSTDSLFSVPSLGSTGFALSAASAPSFDFSLFSGSAQNSESTLYQPPPSVTIPSLQQQDIPTGEEDERRLLTLRARLFKLEPSTNSWKERGVGQLHFNVASSERARIVMRSEGVLKLILNTPVFSSMACQRVQEKGVRLTALDEQQKPASFLLRFSRKDEADQFASLLERHIGGDNTAKQPNSQLPAIDAGTVTQEQP